MMNDDDDDDREREAMRTEAQGYIAHIKELDTKLAALIEQQSKLVLFYLSI